MSDSNPREIAGDFISLVASRQMPLWRTSSDSVPIQTQGTTVFAFQCAEGVLMAGDRRATAGNVIVTDRIEKVIELDATSLLAIAGVPAMAFEMVRVLQTSFEYYRRSQLQALSLPARVRSLARLLRDNLPMTMQGIGVVMPIFAGVNATSEPSRPEIHFYDPLGAQFHAVDYAASGSGALTIRSILGFQHHFGNPPPVQMNLQAAVALALRMLMVASELDSATGGVSPGEKSFATIKLLRPDGIITVSEEQQAAWLSSHD